MANHPTTKISETILRFGEPLISQLPEDHGEPEFDACMKIVISVWNAVSLDDVEGSDRWTVSLVEHAAAGPVEMIDVLEHLVERKRSIFGGDLRGVGEHWIRREKGGLIFGCDARDIVTAHARRR